MGCGEAEPGGGESVFQLSGCPGVVKAGRTQTKGLMAKQTAAFKRGERERHRRRNLRRRRAAERDISAVLSSPRTHTPTVGDAEFRAKLEQAIGVDLDTGRRLR